LLQRKSSNVLHNNITQDIRWFHLCCFKCHLPGHLPGHLPSGKRRWNVYDKKFHCCAKDNRTAFNCTPDIGSESWRPY